MLKNRQNDKGKNTFQYFLVSENNAPFAPEDAPAGSSAFHHVLEYKARDKGTCSKPILIKSYRHMHMLRITVSKGAETFPKNRFNKHT